MSQQAAEHTIAASDSIVRTLRDETPDGAAAACALALGRICGHRRLDLEEAIELVRASYDCARLPA
jgi:hypothetical protein